jgi:hypothetical protein
MHRIASPQARVNFIAGVHTTLYAKGIRIGSSVCIPFLFKPSPPRVKRSGRKFLRIQTTQEAVEVRDKVPGVGFCDYLVQAVLVDHPRPPNTRGRLCHVLDAFHAIGDPSEKAAQRDFGQERGTLRTLKNDAVLGREVEPWLSTWVGCVDRKGRSVPLARVSSDTSSLVI